MGVRHKWSGGLLAVSLATLSAAAFAWKPRPADSSTMVQRSDAVVVGTVVSIDERASDDPDNPLTVVHLGQVEKVRGQEPSGETVDLVFRGGVTPDGQRQTFSNVPALVVGDRYIFTLRSDYYVSPLLPERDALLRLTTVRGNDVAVDMSGRIIKASPTFGLLRGSKIADSLEERAEKARAERGTARVPETVSSFAQDGPLPGASAVLALLRAQASHTSRAPGVFPIAPLSLPPNDSSRTPQSTQERGQESEQQGGSDEAPGKEESDE